MRDMSKEGTSAPPDLPETSEQTTPEAQAELNEVWAGLNKTALALLANANACRRLAEKILSLTESRMISPALIEVSDSMPIQELMSIAHAALPNTSSSALTRVTSHLVYEAQLKTVGDLKILVKKHPIHREPTKTDPYWKCLPNIGNGSRKFLAAIVERFAI